MKPRFLADADLHLAIVLALQRREPTLDFQTATEAGLTDLDDPEVLALAAASGRILVTHDRRSMPHHFATFIANRECPGVIIAPQKLPIATTVEELTLIWALTDHAEWVNRLCCLPL